MKLEARKHEDISETVHLSIVWKQVVDRFQSNTLSEIITRTTHAHFEHHIHTV